MKWGGGDGSQKGQTLHVICRYVPSLNLKINEPGVFSSKLNGTQVYSEEKYSYNLFQTCVLPL